MRATTAGAGGDHERVLLGMTGGALFSGLGYLSDSILSSTIRKQFNF